MYVFVDPFGNKLTLLPLVDDCSTTPPVTVTVVAAKLPRVSRDTNVLGTSSDVAASTVVYVFTKCV